MRKEFGKWIDKKAFEDESIILIVGDIGYSIFDDFREHHPNRFINIGICEQSMIGVSAGLSLHGFKPYVYTITPFLIERPFEQIKIDIACNQANVKLVGYANYPKQGPTHTCSNESILECLDVDCYYPKNSKETFKYLEESYNKDKASFLSLK